MHALGIFRWVLALTAGLFGWWLIILNFAIVYAWFVRRQHSSWIPLVGGLLAMLGMGLCPVPHIQRLAWIPLLVDSGFCISALIIGLLMELYARRTRHDD
jgi:hypothetical protein